MYCKKCGKKCNDNALYCQRCGAELYEKRTTKKGIAVVIIIGAICVAVVLILFAIGILGTGNSQTADMQDEAYQDKEGLHAEEQQNDDYDLYYKDKSTVITRWMVQESETTKTETETNDYLIGRGFTDYPITVEYSIDGKHNKAEAITIGSADKHPIYKTNLNYSPPCGDCDYSLRSYYSYKAFLLSPEK